MKEIVFLNGKFIPAQEAMLPVVTPGFLYGWGLFESMRALRGKIIYLDAHLERLRDSCALVGIKLSYSTREFKNIIRKVIAQNNFTDAYIRLTLWKSEQGTDILVRVIKYKAFSIAKYHKGFRLYLSSFTKDEHSLLSRLKTTNYLLSLLAYQEAKEKGFDEALILNCGGYISEAARSNIFLIKENQILTPDLACGGLDGITRRVILDLAAKFKIKIYEGKFVIRDLLNAEEAFLTNSLIGVMPLASLGRKMIGDDRCGRLSSFMQKQYNSLLK
ncbi:MAG: aminotransferase class IV [Candidatus Omnitrophica bacterium]|nr:aminotransferase class IV [Candidatus Omnitrophota bacterium]